MNSVLKMIGAVLILWFSIVALVMGVLTTGAALTMMLFVLGLLALFGGTWLVAYLLRRDANFDLHLPLIRLVCMGGVVAGAVVLAVREFH